MNRNRIISFVLIILIPFFLFFLRFASTASAGMKRMFTPRISLLNQYDDNIDLQHENERSDWITTLSPGLSFGLESLRSRMNLDYEAGFVSYRDDSSQNIVSHKGTGLWERQLNNRLKLTVSDTFIRSEDPILVGEEGLIEIFERRIYHRNNGQASLTLQFGADDQMSMGYRNRYLDNESSRFEDSVSHEGFLNLDAWCTPRFGISLTSSINRGRFKQPDPDMEASENFYQYKTGLTVNYRWHPSRRLYARYDLLYQDYDEHGGLNADTDNFRVHQGALGLALALSSVTEFSAEGGYFVQDFFSSHKKDGGTFDARLSTRKKRATLRLSGSGGYDQDYFSAENLGSSRFRQALGSADYRLTEHLRVFASASYRWADFFQEDELNNRKDRIWRANTGFSFSYRRWLTLSLDGTHSERESTDPATEFRDNRVMIRLTGAYPVTF